MEVYDSGRVAKRVVELPHERKTLLNVTQETLKDVSDMLFCL